MKLKGIGKTRSRGGAGEPLLTFWQGTESEDLEAVS
jgi:hypothetical protein